MSYSRFKPHQVKVPGGLILKLFHLLGLIDIRTVTENDVQYIECSNMTILNLTLKYIGPVNEMMLTIVLLNIQAIFSLVALFIRYPLAKLFYDH